MSVYGHFAPPQAILSFVEWVSIMGGRNHPRWNQDLISSFLGI